MAGQTEDKLERKGKEEMVSVVEISDVHSIMKDVLCEQNTPHLVHV